ncbi:hypothetical protein [Tahibacter amnicola]|uniref:Uncharacterized protein n=1 Tax=Tahibacter amnicola TaxID=2976241 RepID=A0ABY6BNZ7_9GAMM|nr:hypothetical protein [Tahibacter amnicola]UXI70286.1 hypothetical protein N4264_11815 [Tahibacter amnicola]
MKNYYELADGQVHIWLEQGHSVCMKAVTDCGDPVELSDNAIDEVVRILTELKTAASAG